LIDFVAFLVRTLGQNNPILKLVKSPGNSPGICKHLVFIAVTLEPETLESRSWALKTRITA